MTVGAGAGVGITGTPGITTVGAGSGTGTGVTGTLGIMKCGAGTRSGVLAGDLAAGGDRDGAPGNLSDLSDLADLAVCAGMYITATGKRPMSAGLFIPLDADAQEVRALSAAA